MSDAIAVAAPIGVAITDYARQNPEVVGAFYLTVVSAVIDGLTTRVALFSKNPWLIDVARWGATQTARIIRDRLAKGDKR